MGGIPVKRHYLEQKHLLKKCVQFLRQSMTDKNIARVHRQSLQLMKMIQKPLLDRRLKLSGGGWGVKKTTNTTENDAYRITLHKPCIRNTINSRITEYLDDSE